MNNVKQLFSIKDLENLCGVKAHTIRIWEKRYNLLNPDRTDTNIRTYNLSSLQKLLNVTYLVNSGYKISRISKLDRDEINSYVRRIVSAKSTKNQAINSFKIAMLNYDQELFLGTYAQLEQNSGFRQIFYEIFIPFLNEIGLLWQTDTISPSHEHFITNLIKQKLLINIEHLQVKKSSKTDKLFILFLPENEVHDLGLMFVNHEILFKGYRAISLGPSVPLDGLPNPSNFNEEVIYVSYFTVKPEQNAIESYLRNFDAFIGTATKSQLWMLGKQTQHLLVKLAPNHRRFNSIEELTLSL